MTRYRTEAELAAAVVAWLDQERYEVAQEVELPGVGVLDIVARMGRKLWVVEAKLSMSLALVAQAQRRLGYAHRVSIAVPEPKRKNAWATDPLQNRIGLLRSLGIGVISAGFSTRYVEGEGTVRDVPAVRERCQGVYVRPGRLSSLEDALRDEHFTGEWSAAGTKDGGHYTAFGATARRVVEFVRENPGCSIGEIIEGGHHYANDKVARARIDVMIRQGVIGGIRRRGSGRQRRYYPEGAA